MLTLRRACSGAPAVAIGWLVLTQVCSACTCAEAPPRPAAPPLASAAPALPRAAAPGPAAARARLRSELESEDPAVRSRALETLADLHDAEDLEAALRASIAHADLSSIVAARGSEWADRRAVPALVELLDAGGGLAESAALSLSRVPSVPVFEPEQIDPTAPTSRAPPYRRWWSGGGRSSFAAECTWWTSIAGPRPVCAVPTEPAAEPPPRRRVR